MPNTEPKAKPDPVVKLMSPQEEAIRQVLLQSPLLSEISVKTEGLQKFISDLDADRMQFGPQYTTDPDEVSPKPEAKPAA